MSNIFKIYINNNNNLTDLYLFIKNKYLSNVLQESIETLQSKYSNSKLFIESEIFNNIFSNDFDELDIKFIKDFDINIYFVDQNIYYDDTLETIKFKFLKYFNNNFKTNQLSFEEIFMYALINKQFNPAEIYNSLTNNNNNNKISSDNLKQYLLNLNEQIQIFNTILKFNQNKEKIFIILTILTLYNLKILMF